MTGADTLASLQLPSNIAFVEIRRGAGFRSRGGWRCRGTSSESRCESDYAAVWLEAAGGERAVVRRGDRFHGIGSLAELAIALDGIDTADEAILAAVYGRFRLNCGGQNPATVRANGENWLLSAYDEDGAGQVIVQIERSGGITELRRRAAPFPP